MSSYFFIITALAIWSSWGLVIRGLDMPVHVILFYNALFGLVFQGVALFFVGKRRELRMSSELGSVALLGLCGFANLMLFFYALKATTVAGALLTHYTAPVFVALLAPLMLGDRSEKATLLALGISAAGLVLIFSTGAGPSGMAELLGLAAGTASGLAYAFGIIIARSISARHHPVKVVFVQGVITVLCLGLWVAPSGAAVISLNQGLILAVLGLMHSTLAVAIYLYGIRGVTAQEAGILGYLEPVLGILLAYLFLGESPHAMSVAGGAMILAAGSMVIIQGAAGRAGGTDDYRS